MLSKIRIFDLIVVVVIVVVLGLVIVVLAVKSVNFCANIELDASIDSKIN